MNYKVDRNIERMKSLIEESSVVLSSRKNGMGRDYISDKTALNSWLTKVKNIIHITFGVHSVHNRELLKTIGARVQFVEDVEAIKGLLMGALDDLENGFITGQEIIIANEIFGSVLEEAKHLHKTNHKDAAAVLGRVVLEDSLKRLAKNEDLNTNMKTSRINDELKKLEVYSQPQWRLIQSWLDVGNAAAHGKFTEYDVIDVRNMLDGIEQFVVGIS